MLFASQEYVLLQSSTKLISHKFELANCELAAISHCLERNHCRNVNHCWLLCPICCMFLFLFLFFSKRKKKLFYREQTIVRAVASLSLSRGQDKVMFPNFLRFSWGTLIFFLFFSFPYWSSWWAVTWGNNGVWCPF